jgi:hypothetical protein
MSTRPAASPLHVTLYSKAGCHLCEQAVADLAQLRRQFPHTLEVVDISRDTELTARYGLLIPVLVVAEREYAAPLELADIERALASAASLPGATEVGLHGA